MENLVRERAVKLMLMDEFICNECDEETWGTWITYGVPDGNGDTIEDYIWLAENAETYAGIKRVFLQIITPNEHYDFIKNYLPKQLEMLDN